MDRLGDQPLAQRRFLLALGASLLLHGVAALWAPATRPAVAPHSEAASSVTVLLTSAESAPRAAASELAAASGEGGGNSERPGHAESVALPSEEDLPVAPAPAPTARLRSGDSLSLPTGRTMTSDGQRAPEKGSRQAESESPRGRAERGGDECTILGFYFCGGGRE